MNNQITENEKQKESNPLTNPEKTEKLPVSAATDADNDKKKMVEFTAISSHTTGKWKNNSFHKKAGNLVLFLDLISEMSDLLPRIKQA